MKGGGEKLEIKRAIEVGNIFKLRDKFSRAINFTFVDQEGKRKPILMGCYGIGLPRLMGAIVEVYHDEKGICWPKEVAPFQISLIKIENTKKVKQVAKRFYRDLQNQNLEVLYDDREDKTAGEKFADADLIGIPLRLVVSERTLKQNCVEIKERSKKKTNLISYKHISIKTFKHYV